MQNVDLELNVAPTTGPTRAFDLEDVLPISVLDGEPRVDEATVLLDVADGSTWG